MQDHRENQDPSKKIDITKLVREHSSKHPGSVRRSDKAKKRASAKRAAESRRKNWSK